MRRPGAAAALLAGSLVSGCAKSVREKIKVLPGVSRSGFLRAVKRRLPPGGRVALPCPEAVTYFTRTGGVWTIAATDADWSAPKR